MVQIAAVSNPEDASVLTNALRKRGYTVTARREPADGLIHVRIGPFYEPRRSQPHVHEAAQRRVQRDDSAVKQLVSESASQRVGNMLSERICVLIRHGAVQPRIHSGRPEAMAARTASDSSSRVA